MSHVRRSDWAATVPWNGILDKPASIGQPTDIGDLSAAGFSPGDSPEWNGSKFVPGAGGGGGGSGPSGIEQLDSPGVATKRIKPGTTEFQYVWLREVFDVREYGADPTGSGDSTESFNAAISALNSGGGGALVVPAGRYRISSPLNRILARCWVRGAGIGTSIIEASVDVFWVTSAAFFGASGMTLIGSNVAATGIRIQDSAETENFVLSDLRITGFGYAISIDTVLRSGWVERCRLEAAVLALLLTASDSFVRGVSIYNGGDNTRNGFEMTGYRNQVSDFKILGDSSNFKKGLFVNDGGNHLISSGMIIGCDEEAISLSNGTGGVTGCRVQNISWLTIGTDPDVVSYDATTNWVDDLYEIGTAGSGGTGVVLVSPPTHALASGANNQIANDGTYLYSYRNTNWFRVAIASWGGTVVATGGVVTTDGAYTIHTFISSGSFVVTNGGMVELLVLGGGGGGSCGNGGGNGGGGSGGYQVDSAFAVIISSYSVTVGAGGAGGTNPFGQDGSDGGDSIFDTITAIGGGGGGVGIGANGHAGGSGGGAGGFTGGGANTGGAGSQGNNGGDSISGAPYSSGGGGGAGTAGGNGTGGGCGNGGDGINNPITGAIVAYGGGGGGGAHTSGSPGSGGSGGGGNGGSGTSDGANGTNGLGGGGGGAGSTTGKVGGSGGSGVVIIRYLTP